MPPSVHTCGCRASEEPLWTREEAARAAHISPRTLEGLDRAGRGPDRVKLGGAVRYRPADVRRWIDEARV